MKNELIESRLRRDNTIFAFLTKDANKTRYVDIEADIASIRGDLAANLVSANSLIDQVLAADNDNATVRKRGFRNQLTELLIRRVRAIRAHANGNPQPDTDLLSRLPHRPSVLRKLSESSFAEEAKRLLHLATDIAPADLANRRYTPTHHSQATALLQQLTATSQEGITNDDAGATGRQALERLIKANARLLAALDTFFILYNDPEDETAYALYKEWRQARKVDQRGGSEGPRDKGDKGEKV